MNEDHPLKVYYPYGGRHFLLHYWTYNERGHIILARSESALTQTFKRILSNKDIIMNNFKIQNLSEIEIFAPPKDLCIRAKEIEYQQKLNDFYQSVIYHLKHLFKEEKFPSQFIRCEQYLSKYDEQPDKEELKEHYSCKNCFNGIRLKNLSIEEFYNTYHKKWYELFSKTKRKFFDQKRLYSRASVALDDQNLMMAIPNFGHHCDGIVLESLNKEQLAILIGVEPLFYFELIQKHNIDIYQKMINEAINNYEKLKKQISLRHTEELNLRNKKEIQQMMFLFGVNE